MLKLSCTFETITHESAENGDFESTGFVFEEQKTGARELFNMIRRGGFTEPSESRGVPRWLTCSEYGLDYRTGEVENRSIYPGSDAQSQKVWAKVLKIAGVSK